MLKKFYPYEYVESVFSIDYQKLYDKGYKGVIFDIDNTHSNSCILATLLLDTRE